MNKLKAFLAGLVLSLAVTGCTTFDTSTRTLSVVTSATNLSYYYTNGDIVNFVGHAELSEMELTSVLEALDQIDRSKQILQHYKDKPDQLVLNIEDVAFQYAKIKSAYLSIRSVVLDNFDEYGPVELRSFQEFDRSAQVLDIEFEALVEAVETNTAIVTALNLANTAIKVGAML